MLEKNADVRETVNRLGRPAVMSACGVKTQAITNWIADGRIPPNHYSAFRRLCEINGSPTPDHLFFGAAA
jgi:hypothetical protein